MQGFFLTLLFTVWSFISKSLKSASIGQLLWNHFLMVFGFRYCLLLLFYLELGLFSTKFIPTRKNVTILIIKLWILLFSFYLACFAKKVKKLYTNRSMNSFNHSLNRQCTWTKFSPNEIDIRFDVIFGHTDLCSILCKLNIHITYS